MSYINYSSYYNYNILNDILNKIDFNQKYNIQMDKLFDLYKTKVKTSFLNSTTDKKIQRSRIIKNYIVPLCYLIYSYIYTKYYNLQLKKAINNESDTIYDMLGFLFSSKNPSTKMLNVYYYKEFNKVKENNTNKNKNKNENINLYSKMKDEKEKNILFLQQIISLFRNDSDLTQIYKVIIVNFKKLIKEIIKIVNNIIKINIKDYGENAECVKIVQIKELFIKGYSVNNEFNNNYKINESKKSKESKESKESKKTILDVLQLLSATDLVSPNYKILVCQLNQIQNDTNFKILLDTMLKLDISKYAQIKSQYSELSTLYNKNFLSIINEINKNIILLKNSDEILTEDELSFKFIADRFLYYYKKYDENKKEKKNNDLIIEHITNIIHTTEDEITDFKKIFYNKKINDYNINEIVDKLYVDKNSKIIYLLNILHNNSSQMYNISMKETTINHIKEEINIDIKHLLQLYFISIFVYNNIENKYIKIFLNKSNKIGSEIILIKSSYIVNIKKFFEIKFRIYERNNKDKKSEYIEHLNENEKIFEKENDELIQYESEDLKNSNLNNSKTLSEYQREKNDAIKEYDNYNNKYISKITEFTNFYNDLNLNDIIYTISKINFSRTQEQQLLFNHITDNSIEGIIKSFNSILNQYNSQKRTSIINRVNSDIKNIFSNTRFTSIQQMYINDSRELSSSDFLLEQAFKINNLNQVKLATILQKKIAMKKAENLYERKLRESDIIAKRKAIIPLKKKYYSELRDSIKNQRTKLESENSSKKIIPLDSYGISFDSLINISIDFEKIINIIKYKNTDNKLFFIFETYIEKLDDITKKINSLDTKKNIENLIKDINSYFINSNSTLLFNKLLSRESNSNKIESILEEYTNYNKNLTNKIKVLLNNINKQNIVLNTDSDSLKIKTFKDYIIKNKAEKYNNIYGESKEKSSRINGTIKYIVSYTNVIYMYFIILLIIIDFLTYFYS